MHKSVNGYKCGRSSSTLLSTVSAILVSDDSVMFSHSSLKLPSTSPPAKKGQQQFLYHPLVTHRSVFGPQCSFRHVVFSWPQLSTAATLDFTAPFTDGHQQRKTLLLRSNMSFEEGKEFVSEHGFDTLEMGSRVPAITFLRIGNKTKTKSERKRRHTLQTSRRSLSSSIMSLSIGSVMSQSWKAAVSFVRVTPSKMCEVLPYSSVPDREERGRL